MKHLLWLLLLASSVVQAYTWDDVDCLAKNAFYEARGEGIKGMQAVMDVTLNRKESGKFPNTVCKVVWQKKQFSWTFQKKQRVKEAEMQVQWQISLHLARNMLLGSKGSGRGITKGALFYHEKGIKPYWAVNMQRTKKIENHIFYVASR